MCRPTCLAQQVTPQQAGLVLGWVTAELTDVIDRTLFNIVVIINTSSYSDIQAQQRLHSVATSTTSQVSTRMGDRQRAPSYFTSSWVSTECVNAETTHVVNKIIFHIIITINLS